MPGKLTEGVAEDPPDTIPGPLQIYVPPPDPVNVIVAAIHDNVEGVEIDAVGIGLMMSALVLVQVPSLYEMVAFIEEAADVVGVNTPLELIVPALDGVTDHVPPATPPL